MKIFFPAGVQGQGQGPFKVEATSHQRYPRARNLVRSAHRRTPLMSCAVRRAVPENLQPEPLWLIDIRLTKRLTTVLIGPNF